MSVEGQNCRFLKYSVFVKLYFIFHRVMLNSGQCRINSSQCQPKVVSVSNVTVKVFGHKIIRTFSIDLIID